MTVSCRRRSIVPLIAKGAAKPEVVAALDAVGAKLTTNALKALVMFQRTLAQDLQAWPFQRAGLLHAYGQWLRRRRRARG